MIAITFCVLALLPISCLPAFPHAPPAVELNLRGEGLVLQGCFVVLALLEVNICLCVLYGSTLSLLNKFSYMYD